MVAGFIVAATYISILVVERQQALRRISRYNPTWQASQMLYEFMLLDQRLIAFEASKRGIDKEEVELRYEILSGTAKHLNQGRFGVIAGLDPKIQAGLRALDEALAGVEPFIRTVERPGHARRAIEILEPLQATLVELASTTYKYGAQLTSDDQEELIRLHLLFSGLAVCLIVFGILLISLLARHNGLLGRAHQELHVLANRLRHMAHHDALTDLANRVLFHDHLQQALAKGQPSAPVAVMCLDLDRFKSVNDAFGHGTGDTLLKIVADRLRACIRDGDVVARLSGDEFAILPRSIRHPHECADMALRIVEAVGAPYDIDGHEVTIGTSIGIALSQGGEASPDQLLKHADMALYQAKASGRGTFQFFEPEMEIQLHNRRALEVRLRKALASEEFELFYQPQINVETRTISGFEALLRWHHPERGMVSPAEFIPVAEDIGLIAPLGDWVLEQACMAAAGWPREMKVAVNLSPVQFRSGGLVQGVGKALTRAGLSPSRLELEITESVLLQDNDMTLATLHQLRRLGVRIAMDDFGTGYSSLSYLRSFPFDKIKIDQSFVRELSSRADCLAIVQSIASLGANLGMATVAEGVETEDQFQQIRAAGCTEVQGYYFGKPKPASELAFSLPHRAPAPEMQALDAPRALAP